MNIVSPSFFPSVPQYRGATLPSLSGGAIPTLPDSVQLSGASSPEAVAPQKLSAGKLAFASLGLAAVLAGGLAAHGGLHPTAHAAPVPLTSISTTVATPVATPAPQQAAPVVAPEAKPAAAPTAQRQKHVTTHANNAKHLQGLARNAPRPEPVKSELPNKLEQHSQDDRTILNDVGHSAHKIANGGVDVGKKIGHGFKVFGKGLGHVFGSAGHQIKDGWKSADR